MNFEQFSPAPWRAEGEDKIIVADMDANFNIQMKFEKAINRQPLTVVFTDRRPAEDKQEATQGEQTP